MLRDLLRWCLYSPGRLLAVVAALITLTTLGAVSLGDANMTARPSAVDRLAPRPDASSAQPAAGSVAASERPASESAVRTAAVRFLRHYVVANRRTTVPPALSSTVTPALWEGLRLTQPGLLPVGEVSRVDVLDAGAFNGTARAELDEGAAFSLSVVAWENGWRVSDVRLEPKE